MINLQTVHALKNKGYEMADIMAAINTAETNGEASIDGYLIRYNDRGEMILVHRSWGGIYVGDYDAKIIFQKNLSYTYGRYCYMTAKHGELSKVLAKLDENKTNGYILCECDAGSYNRRKKQVEKLGLSLIHI